MKTFQIADIRRIFSNKRFRNLKIAIIYSDNDKEIAKSLIGIFKKSNIDCWSNSDLIPGQNWALETKMACKNANFVLVLLSNTANKVESEYQQFIRWALDMQANMPWGGIKTIPVKLEFCKTPGHMDSLFAVEPTEKEWLKLVEIWNQYLEA